MVTLDEAPWGANIKPGPNSVKILTWPRPAGVRTSSANLMNSLPITAMSFGSCSGRLVDTNTAGKIDEIKRNTQLFLDFSSRFKSWQRQLWVIEMGDSDWMLGRSEFKVLAPFPAKPQRSCPKLVLGHPQTWPPQDCPWCSNLAPKNASRICKRQEIISGMPCRSSKCSISSKASS